MPDVRTAAARRAPDAPTVAGWASAALGAVLLLRPASGTTVGLGDDPRLIRAAGVTDLAIGAGLLLDRDRRRWMFARMGGNLAIGLLCARTALRRPPHRPRALGLIAVLAFLTVQDARIARTVA